MLQRIRDKTDGWVKVTIIGAVCVAFAFWGVHSFLSQVGSEDAGVAAKVNGQVISANAVNMAYERLRAQKQTQIGPSFVLTEKEQQGLRQMALTQLITTTALSQAALNEGFSVDAQQVGHVISGISAFQEDGHFSQQKFLEAISNLGFSESAFYDDLRNAMLINEMRVGIVASNFALPEEIKNLVNLVNQKRDVRYVLISPKDFVAGIVVSEEEIKKYYDAHTQDFRSPETVALQYIVLDPKVLAAQQHLSDAELKQYYQANIDNFSTPAKWQLTSIFVSAEGNGKAAQQIQDITKDLQQGMAINAVTKKYPTAKIQMSHWLNSQEVDPAIQAKVTTLSPGQLSSPIQTAQGWVVVKLIAVQKPQTQTFEKVRAQVAKALAAQKATQVFSDAQEQLSNLAYTDPNSLAPAAKALNVAIQTTPKLTQDSHDGIFADSKVKDAAFSADALAGNNSKNITLSDGRVLVLRVLTHQASAVQPLAQVHDKIKKILQDQQAIDKAQAAAADLSDKLNKQQDITSWLAGHHLKMVSQENIGRYTAGEAGSVLNAAFRLPRPGKKPSVNMVHLPSGDFAVIEVTKVSQANDGKIQSIQQRVLAEQIASGYAQLDYQLYVDDVLNKAKVKVMGQQNND